MVPTLVCSVTVGKANGILINWDGNPELVLTQSDLCFHCNVMYKLDHPGGTLQAVFSTLFLNFQCIMYCIAIYHNMCDITMYHDEDHILRFLPLYSTHWNSMQLSFCRFLVSDCEEVVVFGLNVFVP